MLFARRRLQRRSARSVAVTGTRRAETVTVARSRDETISPLSSARCDARRVTTTVSFCAKPAPPTTIAPTFNA